MPGSADSEETPENILKLHNWLQSRYKKHPPKFTWVEDFEGTWHDCIWISTLQVGGVSWGTGRGRTKQISRNSAAGQALAHLEIEDGVRAQEQS